MASNSSNSSRKISSEFSSSDAQLVFWVYQWPIADLLSSEHICTQTTTLLAKSFRLDVT